MKFQLKYQRFGECAILVEWPAKIDEDILSDILSFKFSVENRLKHIVEVTTAYHSLLVVYKNYFSFEEEVGRLKEIYRNPSEIKQRLPRLWKIPVCYDDDFGIDLDALSKGKKLTKKDVVQMHSKAIYTVYFIGFLPGFLYLGGLDETLHTPRKAVPRLKIEKGAVAIGGKQTGVYPSESPGGWHIIGNSPISFFNPNKEQPCFASALDQVQFVPISRSGYEDIKTLVKAGVYQMESEVIDG